MVCCSLSCVKQHKLELGCDGKRNKAAFVSLSHFDDNRVLSGEGFAILGHAQDPIIKMALLFCSSDYYFLEDVSRFADSMHRGRVCHDREQGSRSKVGIHRHRRVMYVSVTRFCLSSCSGYALRLGGVAP